MDDGFNDGGAMEFAQRGAEEQQNEGIMQNSKVAKAFVAAQKDFAPAIKGSSNPHFKTRYADLATCVEAVLDALNNHGIALLQPPRDCENGVKVETIFLHESGETLSGGVFQVPATKQDPQGYASALTYARRNGLMAACGIAPEDDDGNAATKSAPQNHQPKGKAYTSQDLQTTLDYVSVAESPKALHNLYGQARQAGANEAQLKRIESACLAREEEIGGQA